MSIVILAVLALQTAASFGALHPFRYWPFLSYPMYNEAHRAEEAVPNFSLVAIDASGGEHSLSPRDLGLDFWRTLRGPVRAAQRGDAHALIAYLEPYEHRTRLRVSAIRLENHPVTLVHGRLASAPAESTLVVVRHAP